MKNQKGIFWYEKLDHISRKDSVPNADIAENFYPKESLLIELNCLEGNLDGKSIEIVAKSSTHEDLQRLEYLFDNRQHITNFLPPDLLIGHEEIGVFVYLKGENDQEGTLVQNYDIKLDHHKPDDERPLTPSYKEKMKGEITAGDIKLSIRIVYV